MTSCVPHKKRDAHTDTHTPINLLFFFPRKGQLKRLQCHPFQLLHCASHQDVDSTRDLEVGLLIKPTSDGQKRKEKLVKSEVVGGMFVDNAREPVFDPISNTIL